VCVCVYVCVRVCMCMGVEAAGVCVCVCVCVRARESVYTPEAASPAMARMGVKQLMQRNCFPVNGSHATIKQSSEPL
jgi:hypothetical protein